MPRDYHEKDFWTDWFMWALGTFGLIPLFAGAAGALLPRPWSYILMAAVWVGLSMALWWFVRDLKPTK